MSTPNEKRDHWVDAAKRIYLAVRSLLFGTIYYRFATGLIAGGIFLVGGGTWRDIAVKAIVEIFGSGEIVEESEATELRAQIVGMVLIALGVGIFLFFTRRDRKFPRQQIAASIIDNWASDRALTDAQTEWLRDHPKWADAFWNITEETDLSKLQRLRKLRLNLLKKA